VQYRDARGAEDRDAEGVEGVGTGVSPSQADRGVWGVVSSPSGVRGGAPAESDYSAFFNVLERLWLQPLSQFKVLSETVC